MLGDSLALSTLIELIVDGASSEAHANKYGDLYQQLLAHLRPEGYFTFAAHGT